MLKTFGGQVSLSLLDVLFLIARRMPGGSVAPLPQHACGVSKCGQEEETEEEESALKACESTTIAFKGLQRSANNQCAFRFTADWH